jgi:hypothetical protein
MQKTYTDYINAALDVLDQSLQVYVEARLKVRYGDSWYEYLPTNIRFNGEEIEWDTQAILNTMIKQWNDAFQTELGYVGRNLVGELKEWRNTVAHRSAQKPITSDDAYRAVDTIWRLLSLIPLPQAQEVRAIRDELQARDAPAPVQQAAPAPVQQELQPLRSNLSISTNQEGPAVTYTYSRFCFKANQIEPLADSQAFRVVTPVGAFQMTKAEFYRAFPKVVVSKSYVESGIYHYPSVPKSAMPYLLAE